MNFELFMLQLQRILFCTDLELTNLYHTKAVSATSGSRESGVYSVQQFAGISCAVQLSWYVELKTNFRVRGLGLGSGLGLWSGLGLD